MTIDEFDFQKNLLARLGELKPELVKSDKKLARLRTVLARRTDNSNLPEKIKRFRVKETERKITFAELESKSLRKRIEFLEAGLNTIKEG